MNNVNYIGITQEWSYRASDGKLFCGKFAKKQAQDYQKGIDFKETVRSLIPAAHKVFNIKESRLRNEAGESEEIVTGKINEEFGWEADTFGKSLHYLATLYLNLPELSKLFQLFEKKFEHK